MLNLGHLFPGLVQGVLRCLQFYRDPVVSTEGLLQATWRIVCYHGAFMKNQQAGAGDLHFRQNMGGN